MAGAAGAGAALASNALVREALGQDAGVAPTDLSFETVTRFRPFNLLAKNFVRLDDSFDRNTTGDYTILRPAPSGDDDGTVRAGNGKLSFAGLDDYYTILKSGTGQRAPYATVIMEVTSLPEGSVYAGLYKDEGNYVHAYYDKSAETIGLEAAVNGQVYVLGTMQPEEQRLFEIPFRFAFVANENEVTALVGDRASDIGVFRPLIKRDATRDDNGTPIRRTTRLRAWICATRGCSRRSRTALARVPVRAETSFSTASAPDTMARPGFAIRTSSSTPMEPRT